MFLRFSYKPRVVFVVLLSEPLADCRSQSLTRLPTTSDLLLDQEKVALLKKSALAGDSNAGYDDFVTPAPDSALGLMQHRDFPYDNVITPPDCQS